MKNADSFSHDSEQYARSRPLYPAELFAYLGELAPQRDCAWDCATGNGQAAVSLTAHFARVEATDISAEQIQHGLAHPRVTYRVTPAEQTGFPAAAFDLVAVAQAVHWFDRPAFFREAGRVLKPQGILAVWGYGFFEIDPQMDALIRRDLLEPLDRFWAAGNRLVMNGYRDISLPFDAIHPPQDFSMQVDWTLPQLLAYLRTWSAVKRSAAELGADPLASLEASLQPAWRDPEQPRPVRMPLFLKVSRLPADASP